MAHDDSTDATIADGLRKQDPIILESIIARFSREIFYFVRMILNTSGSLQDVEECVSDLFISIWEDAHAFDPKRGSFRTWLTMRAKYLALDRRRYLLRRHMVTVDLSNFESGQDAFEYSVDRSDAMDRWRMPEHLSAESLDVVLERDEERRQLHDALKRLSDLDRQLVYMRYFLLQSTEEIANLTGLSKHAVDTRLWRARKHLKETLREPSHGQI